MKFRVLVVSLMTAMLGWSGCGGISGLSSPVGSGGSVVPQFNHVAIVVLENASYDDVINGSSMPYLNSLAAKGALMTDYYASAHPSIPNYFMFTTGQPITIDDSFSGTVSADNLAREFAKDGVSWKAYEDSIPQVGYTGGDSGEYIERHDPFSYFSDVRNSSSQQAKLVPFTQLAADEASGTLPNFLWITPNALYSAHSCPASDTNCSLQSRLATADGWMKSNVAPLLANTEFASSGLLIVVFDEGADTDLSHGGGHVACVLVGTGVKSGYRSTAQYQDQDILSLIGRTLRLKSLPGAGASGGTMTEFFQ